jgi:hypothetical protein
MTTYLDQVNRTKVTPDLLVEVLAAHASMDPEDRGVFEARAFRIFELLKSKGLRARNIADLSVAINFRLMALARLEKVAALRGWSIQAEQPGVSRISFDALKAAAEEPLIENDEGQAVFDVERFRHRVLAGAEPEGRA